MHAEFGKVLPTSKNEVLKYFKVRLEEGAARSVFASLLTALNFLEVAGDRSKAERLGKDEALVAAAREYESKRRQATEEG